MTPDECVKNELSAYIETISEFQERPMPMSAALEFQYGLNHLFAARHSEKNDKMRLRHIDKASGHFHRSHLDWLKSNIFEVQNRLVKAQTERKAYFGFWQGEIRKEELRLLGRPESLHIFDWYRYMLRVISPHDPKETKTGLSIDLAALGEGRPAGKTTIESYMEWTRLESQLAAFSGERWYDHILMVVQAFLQNQLDNILPRFIAVLKLALLKHLNRAYKSKAMNGWEVPGLKSSADFDLFENGVGLHRISFHKLAIKKWKECRDFDPKSLAADPPSDELQKLMAGIDEPFRAYDKLVNKFVALMQPEINIQAGDSNTQTSAE